MFGSFSEILLIVHGFLRAIIEIRIFRSHGNSINSYAIVIEAFQFIQPNKRLLSVIKSVLKLSMIEGFCGVNLIYIMNCY